jgi:hypothetical protein
MDIGPIFFKEIPFFDFLEESTLFFICAVVRIWEGEIEEQDFPFLKQAQCPSCRSPVRRKEKRRWNEESSM